MNSVLHESVRRFYREVGSINSTANHFRINWRTAKKIIFNVPRKKRTTIYTAQDIGEIEKIVRESPNLYLDEIRDELLLRRFVFLGTSTVWKIMNTINITRKVASYPAMERFTPMALELRARYLGQVSSVPISSLYFIDETGVDFKTCRRRFGRARRGVRPTKPSKYVKNTSFTMLSAISTSGFVSFHTITQSAATIDFSIFITEKVLPFIPEGSVLIIDNASIHKDPALEAIVQLSGNKFLFLPPYSPDLNPIEISYAYIKKKLQRRGTVHDEDVVADLSNIMRNIQSKHIKAWAEKCGYIELGSDFNLAK